MGHSKEADAMAADQARHHPWVAGARRACARLADDRRGVAAIEFALIAPLMLAMYFVSVEVVQGIESNDKVARIASTVADLVTQQPEMSVSELEAIMRIGESIIQPYNRTTPTIVVTAIEVTSPPNSTVQVAWSRKLAGGAFTKPFTAGSPVSIPPELNVPGSFLVRVESELSYQPIMTWTADKKQVLGLTGAFDGIEMKETYYLGPRMSSSIPCVTC